MHVHLKWRMMTLVLVVTADISAVYSLDFWIPVIGRDLNVCMHMLSHHTTSKSHPSCLATMQSWIEDMSAYVKSQARNQLVTVGLEGFYGKGAYEQFNLQPWMSGMGTDWISNNAIPQIDFVSIHMWPDNWAVAGSTQPELVNGWIMSHLAVARDVLGDKPVLLQEFGKKLPAVNSSVYPGQGEHQGLSQILHLLLMLFSNPCNPHPYSWGRGCIIVHFSWL